MTGATGGDRMRQHPDAVIRIAVIDDHRLFREGVRGILSTQEDFLVVAEGVASEAIDVAARFQPDVLLLDIQHAFPGPLTTIRQVARVSPATRVVVLSVDADNSLIRSLA